MQSSCFTVPAKLVRRGWSQHADARSAEGVPVQPWQKSAVAWSLLGALVATLEQWSDRGRDLPVDHLAAALNELAKLIDDDSLTDWNDEPVRTAGRGHQHARSGCNLGHCEAQQRDNLNGQQSTISSHSESLQNV